MRSRRRLESASQQILTVLDIGTSKISCLIARLDDALHGFEGQKAIHILGFGHCEAKGIKAGTVIDLDGAEKSIRSAVSHAENMAGIDVREVVISVSCGRLKSMNFAANIPLGNRPVNQSDLDRLMGAARAFGEKDGRLLMHMIPVNYMLDDHDGIQDPRGMMADTLSADMHVVTADQPPLRNLYLAIERSHLNIIGYVGASYASALGALVEDEMRLGAVCIDIGAGTTNVSVFAEEHFIYCDNIVVGAHNATLDIARAVSTPPHEAERLKILHGRVLSASSDAREMITFPTIGGGPGAVSQISKAQLGAILRPRMEEILVMVRERLIESGFMPYAGQRVVLTGGGSLLAGMAELTAHIFSKSVRIGGPKPMAGMPDRSSPVCGPGFSCAAGLLHYPFQPDAQLGAALHSEDLQGVQGYWSKMSDWLKESF